MTDRVKHNHYFKDVRHLKEIDVYRVLDLFNVTDPCLAHAVKKLLVAGGRGAGKDQNQDVCEAIDSLQRFLAMREEDQPRRRHPSLGEFQCIICGGTGIDYHRPGPSKVCFCREPTPGKVLYVEKDNG